MSGIDLYTKLLLHCNGEDAGTTFRDSSLVPKTITAVGTAQMDTAQKKFGTASCLLDGNSDYLSIADHADFEFDGDFTIDGWVKWNSVPTAFTTVFQSSIADFHGVHIVFDNSTTIRALFANAAGDAWTFNSTAAITAMTTGVWYHFAMVRSGTTVDVYWGGVSKINETGVSNTPNHTGDFYVGAANLGSDARYVNGWIDEFRVSKGVARWTSNFTPPVREYSLDGGSFLLNFI